MTGTSRETGVNETGVVLFLGGGAVESYKARWIVLRVD